LEALKINWKDYIKLPLVAYKKESQASKLKIK
jgi:hypothetical protein